MFLSILKKIWNNETTRSLFFICIGLVIGLALYPSSDNVKELQTRLEEKQTEITNLKMVNEEKLDQLESKHRQIEAMSQEKIRSLEVENKKLVKQTKFKKVITTFPDGTKKEEIILINKEVEVTKKLKQLEQDLTRKFKSDIYILNLKHETAIRQLNKSHEEHVEKLRTEKLREVQSSKKLGLGLKYSSDNSMGAHLHYHLLGNVFVMSGLDLVDKSKLRYSVGLGLSL
jgi:hypothetical protein